MEKKKQILRLWNSWKKLRLEAEAKLAANTFQQDWIKRKEETLDESKGKKSSEKTYSCSHCSVQIQTCTRNTSTNQIQILYISRIKNQLFLLHLYSIKSIWIFVLMVCWYEDILWSTSWVFRGRGLKCKQSRGKFPQRNFSLLQLANQNRPRGRKCGLVWYMVASWIWTFLAEDALGEVRVQRNISLLFLLFSRIN